MKFEEKLNELISEVPVPDELSPHNVAKMLKAQNAHSKMESEHKTSKANPNISVLRRTIIIRTVSAAAACAVFVLGMTVYNDRRAEQEMLEEQISYKDVVTPDSYDDWYNIYTGIDLNGGNSPADGDQPIDDEPIPDDTEPIEYSRKNPNESLSELTAYDFPDKEKFGENVSRADVTVTDGKYVYCLKGSTLTVISLETMEIVSTLDSSLDPPIEIYKDGDRVFLISSETEEIQVISGSTDKAAAEPSDAETSSNTSNVPASGVILSNSAAGNSDADISPGSKPKTASRANTLVDIYDVSDPANPVHTISYKQNGRYIVSRLADGTLYLVTDYADYRIKSLGTQNDLDSYVPAYYINGEKFFIEAKDVIVPMNAVSTDYTVAAAITPEGETVTANVRAILGSRGNVCCSNETLYTASSVKNESGEYSVIHSFKLSREGISYLSGGIIDGEILGRKSMNEYGGKLRIASKITDENGIPSTAVYVLDKSLTVENSGGNILHSETIAEVKFEKNYARLFRKNSGTAAAVIDLSSNPPTFAQTAMDGAAFLFEYTDERLLGIGTSAEGGLTLSLFDAATGLTLSSTDFAPGELSKALTDRRAVLIDSENGVIGVPTYSHGEFGTVNRYYVFSCGEMGFSQKGVIEYTDIDDSSLFERGKIIGEKLYVIGGGRVISARLGDMKIIETFEF
ncbi:MAG: beta-propeller domain-containing protein [Ruminococcus sp.]|nr:beta-propeller domain-containing protein [Ruminococcus sp.]MCM1380469.1 beta-propeller domain-containing protein [Muribaculaceae bacterium]MCM1479546.1 beta-propeller domain-containing protein [Muribaculaceae bacterium]